MINKEKSLSLFIIIFLVLSIFLPYIPKLDGTNELFSDDLVSLRTSDASNINLDETSLTISYGQTYKKIHRG